MTYSCSGREKNSEMLLQACFTVLPRINSTAVYGAVTFYHAFIDFIPVTICRNVSKILFIYHFQQL